MFKLNTLSFLAIIAVIFQGSVSGKEVNFLINGNSRYIEPASDVNNIEPESNVNYIGPAPAPAPAPGAAPISDLPTLMTQLHNMLRSFHSAPALVYNTTLEAQALACAKKYVTGTPDGTTVFCKANGGDIVLPIDLGEKPPTTVASILGANALIKAYTTEKATVDWTKLGFKVETRNFFQIVWKASKQFGCVVSDPDATAAKRFLVCVYTSAGNPPLNESAYPKNVGLLVYA